MSKDKQVLFTLTLDNRQRIINVDSVSSERDYAAELLNKQFMTLIHKDYQDILSAWFADPSEAAGFETSILFGQVDGRYRYFSAVIDKDGEGSRVSFYGSGISAPDVVSSTSAMSNLTKKRLLGIYYQADRFGNIVFVDDEIESVVGFKPDDAIGVNLRNDAYRNPAQYDEVKEAALDAGEIVDKDIALKHHDGSVAWLQLNAVVMNDEEGNYIGSSGYVKGITKLRNRDEELEHLKRLLELKQTELDSMTASMKYRVQSQVKKGRREEESILYHSRLAEMGEMVGSIAHQWRQPLSALMFIIEDIRDAYHFGELDVTYLDDAIDECMSYIRFMSETMDDFRNFFRPEPDKEQFQLVDKLVEVIKMQYGRFEVGAVNVAVNCDLTDIGGGMHEVLSIEYGHGVRVFGKGGVTFDAGLIAYGYPNLFKQVIINLINNSIDSIIENRTREGEFVANKGEIDITVKASPLKIFINIHDNGIGIDEKKNLERIFEAEFTTKPKNQGTGIGLHMARSIVEKSLGGKIKAVPSSEGAMFVIELPRVAVR